MKLLKAEKRDLERKPAADGLFTTQITYKVAEVSGLMNYIGPKIQPEVWQQVISFFKWTYDTTKSESQVRLYVNPTAGLWRAWAFPQQGETGMTTKELDNDESKRQRAALFGADDAQWNAWGTVHHHCSCGAFQSSVDENDEKNVSGLHITVGDIDKPHHSMHARLYHQGDLWDVDMSKFWDIGPVLEGLPVSIRALLPANCADLLAREQMCVPSTLEFPEQWRNNLIKVERKYFGSSSYGSSNLPYKYQQNQEVDGSVKWMYDRRFVRRNGVWVEEPWQYDSNQGAGPQVPNNPPKEKETKSGKRRRGKVGLGPVSERVADALNALTLDLASWATTDDQLEELLAGAAQSIEMGSIIQVCKEHDVLPEDILDELRMKLAAVKTGPSLNGAPSAEDTSIGYGDA